jgi:hypothetical protein
MVIDFIVLDGLRFLHLKLMGDDEYLYTLNQSKIATIIKYNRLIL